MCNLKKKKFFDSQNREQTSDYQKGRRLGGWVKCVKEANSMVMNRK